MVERRKADPLRFPDLSLVIVKLMGSGEYVLEKAGGTPVGHSGLAVRDYTHSTAPNRRFPDLITARLVKAALLESRVGEQFHAIVTGASAKGVWVRILKPPVEGKVVRGEQGLDVGQKLTVKLTGTNVERGFIDFVRVR